VKKKKKKKKKPGMRKIKSDFSLLQKRPEQIWGLPSLILKEGRGCFLRLILNNHLHIAPLLKNEWSHTSTTSICAFMSCTSII
jgi:hypothetical protein